MFNEVLNHREWDEQVVVVCGPVHVNPLCRLFTGCGENVTTLDVTKADWFNPFWIQLL